MSTPEHAPVESRSSIKAVMNAKGDPQFEIKLVDGVTQIEVDRLRTMAVATFRQLKTDLGGAS